MGGTGLGGIFAFQAEQTLQITERMGYLCNDMICSDQLVKYLLLVASFLFLLICFFKCTLVASISVKVRLLHI